MKELRKEPMKLRSELWLATEEGIEPGPTNEQRNSVGSFGCDWYNFGLFTVRTKRTINVTRDEKPLLKLLFLQAYEL